MPSYNTLRTAAFRHYLAAGEAWAEAFHVLEFPESWKGPLLDLAAETSSRDRQETSIPIDSLNRALRALVPDVLSVARFAARADRRPWLYSAVPVAPLALYPIIRAWVQATYSKVSPDRVQRTLDRLHPDDLRWERRVIDLASWKTAANGTAKLDDTFFRLLPDVIASWLSQPDLACAHDVDVSKFRRAPTDYGAELVSWPPHWAFDRKGQPWPFSFVLTLAVQTVPFQPFPVLHSGVGVRRWVYHTPNPRSLGDRESNVYLLSSVPWIEGIHHSRSFQVAPIKWEWIPQSRRSAEELSGTLVWDSDLAPILDRLQYQAPLPTPADIFVNPGLALEDERDPTAALVHRTGLKPDHWVASGATPHDRHRLLSWVAENVAPRLRLVDPPERLQYVVRKPKRLEEAIHSDMTPSEGISADQLACRLGLRRASNGHLTLDLLYEHEEMRDLLTDTILGDLGLRTEEGQESDGIVRWETHELTLSIRDIRVGALGDSLDLNPSISKRRDRLHGAIETRRDNVIRFLPSVSGAAAAMVELRGKDFYAHAWGSDPKYAIRLGCIEAGRVTQFITPKPEETNEASENVRYRAKKAWRDLLRQLGFQWTAPHFAFSGVALPDPIQYVGIWLIKLRGDASPTRVQEQVPVAVRLSSVNTDVYATAAGIKDWLPYPDALRAIAEHHRFGGERRDESQVIHFIQQVVDDVVQAGPALLMTHAQNLRSAWKWLINSEMLRDQLRLDPMPPLPIARWQGLRHVRLRTSAQNETPECYGFDRDRIGLAAGLWHIPGSERVFASTASKPVTAQTSVHASKVDRRASPAGRWGPEAHRPGWNPQLVEITAAALQPGDDPWVWAMLTHQLRFVAAHHEDALIYPLPLHLARQIAEYVLPVNPQAGVAYAGK
jgi:hypothetical protein